MLQSPARFGIPAVVLGLTRLGPVFPPFVIEPALLEPPSFMRSFACLGLALFVLGHSHFDSSLLIRSAAQMDLSPSAPGASRFGSVSLLLVTDVVLSGLVPLLHSLAHVSLSAPALDFSCLEPTPLLQSSSCLNASLPAAGLVRLDFSAAAPDFAQAGMSTALRSSSYLDFVPAIAGIARSGSPLLALDVASLDLFMPTRCPACAGLLVLVSQLARLGVSPFVLDPACPGVVALTRSFQHLGFALLSMSSVCVGSPLFAPDCQVLGAFMLLHSCACLETLSSILGLSCSDASVFAVDLSAAGLPLLVHSPACLGSSLAIAKFGFSGALPLVSDCSLLGVFLLLQAPHRTDLLLTVFGKMHLSLSLFVLDPAHSGMLPPPHDFARSESALLVLGASCPAAFLTALDFVSLGLALLPRGFS